VRIAAEVTPEAIGELGLVEGEPVWASVKATQIDVYGADGD
jgi:molybdopterin-binding protein